MSLLKVEPRRDDNVRARVSEESRERENGDIYAKRGQPNGKQRHKSHLRYVFELSLSLSSAAEKVRVDPVARTKIQSHAELSSFFQAFLVRFLDKRDIFCLSKR